MPSKTIFFHIGHGKTGSSALQSCLAKHHERLKSYGYLYPYHPNFRRATQGFVSSGNINPNKDPDWFNNQVVPLVHESSEYHAFIYSAEALFSCLPPLFQQYRQLPSDWKIKVLLAVRNPVEMMASHHQQAVKRGGYSGSLKQFMQNYRFKVRALHHAAKILHKFEQKGIEYSVVNYSRIRMGITSYFLDEMGLAHIVDASVEREKLVNRSLSAQELSLVSSVNTIFGPKVGCKLSDALVDELPSAKPDNLYIEHDDLEELKRVNMEPLLNVNHRLAPDMGLTFDYVPSVQYDIQNALTDEQVEIARNLLFSVARRRAQKMANAKRQPTSQSPG